MDSKEVLFARCIVSAKTSRVDCERVNAAAGSYAEGHVLSSASLWKQVWRGEGKYTASTDILEKSWKQTHFDCNYFAAFLTFPLLCENPQIRTLVKNAASA